MVADCLLSSSVERVNVQPDCLMCSYTEIAIANDWANVTTKECDHCARDSPRTPEAGQKLLIPPCKWAEGCRAVVPLNATGPYYSAVSAVCDSLGVNATDVLLPYIYSSGDIVGPGQNAYVLPCKVECCYHVA